ncbi:MAG: cob(I)yrinic acid a,c-diamide adenosyltransferase [Lachnospiraceae bacterium]|nr:cob(I)yrinic acid a,c-diamide adenosyltransferase [Lachnospiraceae bacterium]MDY5742211.1 cob(I)yrinic acid a,c-diamide adenosyltransferase [Lachnospiraceae bacterium]
MLQIYYGNGKGKTTALVGQCVRAAGAGLNVLLVQFLKDNRSSERAMLAGLPGITLLPGRERVKFTFRMTEEEKAEAAQFYTAQFEELMKLAADYDLIALDELLDAVIAGMLDRQTVLDWLAAEKERREIVITGHTEETDFFVLADYITNMKKERHPYDNGIGSRPGIER